MGGVLIAGLFYAGCTMTRAGYQSPPYAVKAQFGKVEIREFGEMVLAQTPSRLSSEGRDGGFMRLFRFISKGNAATQALPMTTPVLYRGPGEAQSMAFVMPSGMPAARVPAPLDRDVQIVTREPGCFAVLRIRGGRGARAREQARDSMRDALKDAEWVLEGEPEFAFYDPPWIPSFLKKNELVWRVARR